MNTKAKNLILGFLLASSALLPSMAHADDTDGSFQCNDCMVPRVACRQTGNNADTGFALTITSGGFAGLTMATLSEETFAGGREIGRVIVNVQTDADNHPGLVAYSGASFRLVVNRGEETEGQAPARLDASVAGRSVADDFICREL